MTLPRFLHANPVATLTTLDDDDTTAYRALLGRWLIDLALLLDWVRAGRRRHPFHHHRCWDNDEFMALTGLAERDDAEPDESEEDEDPRGRFQSAERLLQRLQQRRAELAQIPVDPNLPLVRSIGWLAELLGLSQADQAVLCFAALLHGDRRFHRAIAEQSCPMPTRLLYKLLARLTGLPQEEVRAALSPTAPLLATGLIEVAPTCVDLEDKIGTRRDLPNLLFATHADAEALMARFLKRSPRRTLTLAHFAHLERDTAAAVGLLRAALDRRIPGTNLLLYGPPGVGKTEFAAVLAEAVGADLYEVDYADEDGDPIRGERRLRAFNLGQRLLARRDNALLLFDEVEDVFEHNPFARLFGEEGDSATAGKAWINRTLENNPVPALWLTNDAESMNRAYLRRFDYAVRFTVPPQSVRIEIARHHLGDWAGKDDWLARIAAHEHLTPAQLERAAKLARHAGNGDLEANRALVRQALDRSATLLRQKRAPARNTVPTGYDLRFLNVDQDIPKLIAALQRRPHGIFCFHGPAGTGKSELARHIADALEKPLLVKRASDLLDMYVGQTEQRLAAMFDDARQRDTALVLDEADSFLRDRRGARQSWEVTQVNELLTQMEAFDGIFIATTNLMESLDAASLRRFPWKIRFDWLKPGQRWGLFAQEFVRLGGDLDEASLWKEHVQQLGRLTPGDVAAVVRQYELWDETPSAREFYRCLTAEVAAKREEVGIEPAAAVTHQRKNATLYG
ncbi:MAG: AAA family ATPase [Candidatus Contendobacter sp.]|nr:AAA family ATPase [Candidatus Contendobacter sp.]MDG4559333.1 AAA family ATPase [Candidatus Contendobacter sp.]